MKVILVLQEPYQTFVWHPWLCQHRFLGSLRQQPYVVALIRQTENYHQFRCIGIASRAAKVLSIALEVFPYLASSSSVSPSASGYEVMLSIMSLKNLIGKDPSYVRGFNNPCSRRMTGFKPSNWMVDNFFVWQKLWFSSTTSSESKLSSYIR